MSLPLISAASFHRNQHNQRSSIPEKNVDYLVEEINSTQNRSIFKLPTTEIPLIDPFMNIASYSSTETFENPSFYNTLNDRDLFHVVCNTPLSRSEGISSFSQILQQNTMHNDTMYNQGIISGSHDPCHDKIMFESQPFDPPVQEGIEITIRDTIDQNQDQTMIKINQTQNKKMKMKRNKPSKKSNSIKGHWTSDEDKKLVEWIKKNGTKKWSHIAKKFEGRIGKQCRERWLNSLCPDIKKDAWSEEEYHILIEAHKVVGKQWAKIAQMLPGRSDTVIKNLWNTTERRKHTKRNKKQDENTIFSPRNILENYIWSITEDKNLPTSTKLVVATANADLPVSNGVHSFDLNVNYDDGNGGKSNDDSNITPQLTTPVVDESTTLVYVPTQASESTSYTPWTGDISKHYGLIDDMWMAMQEDGLIF